MNKLFHLHIKRDFNVRTTGRLLCVCLSLLLSFSLLTGCGEKDLTVSVTLVNRSGREISSISITGVSCERARAKITSCF